MLILFLALPGCSLANSHTFLPISVFPGPVLINKGKGEGVKTPKIADVICESTLSAPSLMVGSFFVPQGRKGIENVRTPSLLQLCTFLWTFG